MWTNALKLIRLVVTDDQTARSPIQKTAPKIVCLNGIHLSVPTAIGAAKRTKRGRC